MKIAVLGAGAMGSVVGGHLAAAGNSVTLIDVNHDFVTAINSKGLRLESDGAQRVVDIRAAASATDLKPVDLIVVLVKSFHTQDAIKASLNLLGPDTTVLSLQNGLGHEEVLAEIAGKERVIAGKTYVGGVLTAPGHVVAGVRGKETIIGELDGRITPRIRKIAETFGSANLVTSVSDNILGAMWDKLLINVAAGALSGITGLNFGNLYDLPEAEETGIEAVAEAMRVAQALGVPLETAKPEEAWTKASDGLPFEFKPSVLQALERGQITEIDFINGAVVRAGRNTGIATPVNATLVACMKGLERALDPKVAAK